MNIELSKPEIELLEQALVTWEQEAMQAGMTSAMLSAILPGASKEDRKIEMDRELQVAKVDSQQRRIKSVMLRAKLLQALNCVSEHMLDT